MSTVHCDSAATRWIVFNNLRLIGLQRSYAEREREMEFSSGDVNTQK